MKFHGLQVCMLMCPRALSYICYLHKSIGVQVQTLTDKWKRTKKLLRTNSLYSFCSQKVTDVSAIVTVTLL